MARRSAKGKAAAPRRRRVREFRVTMMGGFQVAGDGAPLPLLKGGARIVALLALGPDPLRRSDAALELRPHLDADGAAASLRSELSRLHERAPRSLVDANRERIWLGPRVTSDVKDVEELLESLAADPCRRIGRDRLASLTRELLPGWDDDWAVVHRERLRKAGRAALLDRARALGGRGRYDEALLSAYQVIVADYLREDAVEVVLEIDRARGSHAEAKRTFLEFEERLRRRLGVPPGDALRALVSDLLREDGRGR